jgi:uncharacterized membrane protein
MVLLILGIVIFLGAHTFTTLRARRQGVVDALGLGVYKISYSIVSLIGFVLICVGFSRYRADGWIQLWSPPMGMAHLTILLMWFAFVSLAAMNPTPSRIHGWLRHPMLVAIKIWALAHLLANGDLGGVILFGSFLAWAVYDRVAVKRRGDLGAARVASFARADVVTLIVGTIAWIAMMFLHPYLIGVAVIGMF